MELFPYVALLFAVFVFAWGEYRRHREARRLREDLLKRHPELRRHFR